MFGYGAKIFFLRAFSLSLKKWSTPMDTGLPVRPDNIFVMGSDEACIRNSFGVNKAGGCGYLYDLLSREGPVSVSSGLTDVNVIVPPPVNVHFSDSDGFLAISIAEFVYGYGVSLAILNVTVFVPPSINAASSVGFVRDHVTEPVPESVNLK